VAPFPFHFECHHIRTNRSCVLDRCKLILHSCSVQEKSFTHPSTPLEAGTIQGLPIPFTNCYWRSYQMDSTWLPIQRSRRVPVDVLGKYVPRFRPVQIYQLILKNSLVFLLLTANSFCSNNLRNGGCVPCRARSAAFAFHLPSKIHHLDRIYWRSVSASTMSKCGVSVSTKSVTSTNQYGHQLRRCGCGQSLRG